MREQEFAVQPPLSFDYALSLEYVHYLFEGRAYGLNARWSVKQSLHVFDHVCGIIGRHAAGANRSLEELVGAWMIQEDPADRT